MNVWHGNLVGWILVAVTTQQETTLIKTVALAETLNGACTTCRWTGKPATRG
jgi:hypothetical protein